MFSMACVVNVQIAMLLRRCPCNFTVETLAVSSVLMHHGWPSLFSFLGTVLPYRCRHLPCKGVHFSISLLQPSASCWTNIRVLQSSYIYIYIEGYPYTLCCEFPTRTVLNHDHEQKWLCLWSVLAVNVCAFNEIANLRYLLSHLSWCIIDGSHYLPLSL